MASVCRPQSIGTAGEVTQTAHSYAQVEAPVELSALVGVKNRDRPVSAASANTFPGVRTSLTSRRVLERDRHTKVQSAI
jgi:hypothetical protein